MELRRYWQVLADRAPVVIGTFLVALIVATASVLFVPQVSSPYEAVVSLSVEPRPEAKSGAYYTYDSYYAYVASEYLNDDLIALVESNDFLQAVRERLKDYPGGPPTGSIKGKKAHRVVTFTVSSPTANGALALARALDDLLTSPGAKASYFDRISAQQDPQVTVIDQPQIVAGPAGRSAVLNIAARALVGLLIGVGLAFLLDYLDDSVRDTDVQALVGLPVVGEIPGRGLPRPRKKAWPSTPQREGSR